MAKELKIERLIVELDGKEVLNIVSSNYYQSHRGFPKTFVL